jgi:uncharacterized protein YciI
MAVVDRTEGTLATPVVQDGAMYWLLFYDLVDDYLERRAPLRAQHLGLAGEAYERGELVMAGALADPADGAILVFRADSSVPAQQFASEDPYVKQGLVSRWRVRQWTVVIGEEAPAS